MQIKLKGKKYTYDLNLNAMANFEKETGKSLTAIGEDATITDIRALLWAGLNEGEEIGIEAVGKLVDINNIEEVSEKIMQLYESAMPDEGKNKISPIG